MLSSSFSSRADASLSVAWMVAMIEALSLCILPVNFFSVFSCAMSTYYLVTATISSFILSITLQNCCMEIPLFFCGAFSIAIRAPEMAKWSLQTLV